MNNAPDTAEVALPTFAILARFRERATTAREAIASVEARLTAAQEPFHHVDVERQEDDDNWMVVARFVLVSVDGHTAVVGLHETLMAAGLAPDEVWADRQVS